MEYSSINERLARKGLKVTNRRSLLLEAVVQLNHPTAEEILVFVRKKYPDTATATVYKALNILVEKNVITKVNTEGDVFRYDAVLESHHHLYCSELKRIEDYVDEELSAILRKYFEKRKIPGFSVQDIKLQITGKFNYD